MLSPLAFGNGQVQDIVSTTVVSRALSPQDPASGWAIQMLVLAMSSGNPVGFESLRDVSSDPSHPCAGWAMLLLASAAASGHANALELVTSMATEDTFYPHRPLVLNQLWGLAVDGHDSAIRALRRVAHNRGDPARCLALLYLGVSEGGLGEELAAIAQSPGTLESLLASTLLDQGRHSAVPGISDLLEREDLGWRSAAIFALGLASARGRQWATIQLAGTALRHGDPCRPLALEMLFHATSRGERQALDVLAKIARNSLDSASRHALSLITRAAGGWSGTTSEMQSAAIRELVSLMEGSLDGSARNFTLWELLAHASAGKKLPDGSSLWEADIFRHIVLDPNDSARGVVIRQLGIEDGLSAKVIEALRKLARRSADPAASWATEVLIGLRRRRGIAMDREL